MRCRCLVEHAPLLGAQVQELTCRDMLRGCIAALPASSGSTQAELLGLARDILALRQPLSRQVRLAQGCCLAEAMYVHLLCHTAYRMWCHAQF